MPTFTEHQASYAEGVKTIHYLAAGPSEGPLIIFLHGWPAIALSWTHQLQVFAALGFRAVAPDMPGWGQSTTRRVVTDYSQESLVEGMLALLEAEKRPSAIWVGHDWGAGVASSLAAHHPEIVDALILACIPYKSAELGLDHLVSLVDRSVYPEEEYPFGQWDYMACWEESFDKLLVELEANIPGLLTILWAREPLSLPGRDEDAVSAALTKPAFTSNLRKNGGLFGGTAAPPVEVLPPPLLQGEVFDTFVSETEKTGMWSGSAYYLNHKANAAYNSQAPNDGKLGSDTPVLFVHAKFDLICPTLTSRLSEPMRHACESLTEVSLETGHNIYFEKPEEFNAALVKFLVKQGKGF